MQKLYRSLMPRRAGLLLLLLVTAFSGHAQLTRWGVTKEQVVKGVFAQYGDQTIFFEWRRQIKDDYPKSTILLLRTDTTVIRSPFSVDERTLRTSIDIPSLIQVLYLQKGGPGPDDFKSTSSGMMVRWMELPIESEVTGSYMDFWRLVPGKGYVRDSSCGYQIMDFSNMGHQRDTVTALQVRYYASGAKWIESSWSPKADSNGIKVRQEKAFYEDGKPLLERTRVWRGANDTLRVKGWHPGGELAFESRQIGGKLDGVFRRFHQNGQVAQEGNYRNGMRTGTWKEFFPDGKPAVEWEYDPLLPESPGYSSRKLISAWTETGERTATAGKGERIWHYLNAEGCRIKVTEQYKAGKKVDEPEVDNSCSSTADFPSVEFAYVRAYRQGDEALDWDPVYAHDWHYALAEASNRHDFYLGGLMHPKYRGQGRTLTKTQVAALLKALNAPASFDEAQGGGKGDPSILLVFYDGAHVPVAHCGMNLGLQRAISSPTLAALEPPKNSILSATGYKALAKLCMELWPGEDGLCDPMGFLPAGDQPPPKGEK